MVCRVLWDFFDFATQVIIPKRLKASVRWILPLQVEDSDCISVFQVGIPPLERSASSSIPEHEQPKVE